MLIADQRGNRLLDLMNCDEEDLSRVTPLTHALVVARRGNAHLLVFNRHRQHWELAGGLIDEAETPRSCAVRELREESGLICDPTDLRFVGAMKFLLQPSRRHADVRIEYGALYVTETMQAAPFVATAEISNVCWWDGNEAIGEISAIDRKLIDLV